MLYSTSVLNVSGWVLALVESVVRLAAKVEVMIVNKEVLQDTENDW